MRSTKRLFCSAIFTVIVPATCSCGAESTTADTAAGPAADAPVSGDPGAPDAVPGDVVDTTVFPDMSDTSHPDVPAAEEDAPEPDGGAPDAGWAAPFDPTVCGSEPHSWLPPGEVGGIVAIEEMGLTDLTPELIDGLLVETGYGGFGAAKHSVRNFRLRYVTQDRGKPVEATATLGVPAGDGVPWPAPVMAWLHGTTGLMDDCAPSADPVKGAVPGTLWSSQGYVTVAPDFIGMLGFGEPSPAGTVHSYLVGEATAVASLDSIRAALAVLDEHPELGSVDPQRVVVAGASQGGHAALFTELYGPHYAPELGIQAVVAVVPPANLLGQSRLAMTEVVNGTANLLGAITAMRVWYGVPGDLGGILTNKEPYFLVDSIEGMLAASCSPDLDAGAIEGIEDVFLPPIVAAAAAGDWDAIPPWGCFLRENSLPGSSVERASDVPILTTFSGDDTLVVTSIEKETWPDLCGSGYRLEYLECAGLGHTKGALAALPYARKWLEDRLAGVPLDEGTVCAIQDPVDCSIIP